MKVRLACAAAAVLAAAGEARADTVTADCSGTTGSALSLGAAVTAANTAPGADTVVLGAGCTYSLSAVDNRLYGPNALPAVRGALTIEGRGATIERAAEAPAMRFFFVGPDGSPGAPNAGYPAAFAGDLTLRDVTLRGGLARGESTPGGGGGGAGFGGAIFNQGVVRIERSTLTGNRAEGGNAAAADGGGGGLGGEVLPDGKPGGAASGGGGGGGGGGGFTSAGAPATTAAGAPGGGAESGLGGTAGSVKGGAGSGAGGSSSGGSDGGDGGAAGAGGNAGEPASPAIPPLPGAAVVVAASAVQADAVVTAGGRP